MTSQAGLLISIYREALESLDPRGLVQKFLNDGRYAFGSAYPVWVFAFGKASKPMMNGFLDAFEDSPIAGGMYITPDSDAPSIQLEGSNSFIRGYTASHPLPDERSVEAASVMMNMLGNVKQGERVFFLISGGSSALMEVPADGITLDQLRSEYDELLKSGKSIHQINSERKKLSAVKGGKLLQFLPAGTRVFNLIISDVPGDDPAIIGSGPTVPDDDAVDAIIKSISGKSAQIFGNIKIHKQVDAALSEAFVKVKRVFPGLLDKAKDAAGSFLGKGKKTEPTSAETEDTGKKAIDPTITTVLPPSNLIPHTFILGSASLLAKKIARIAEEKGFSAEVVHPAYDGDVAHVAEMILQKASDEIKKAGPGDGNAGNVSDSSDQGADSRNDSMGDHPATGGQSAKPKLLVFYGESTVKVRGSGMGGRNTELALQVAKRIEGLPHLTLLSAATDGKDGNTDAAGAVCSAETIQKARESGLDIDDFLKRNDSYSFFDQIGGIFRTGSTGNNLMDVQLVLVEE